MAHKDAWKRREGTVFQVNDQIRRFWRTGYNLGRKDGTENGERIAYVAPIMFDKATRTFNWVLAADPILEAAELDPSLLEPASWQYATEALQKVFGGISKGLIDGDAGEKIIWDKFSSRYDDDPSLFAEPLKRVYDDKHRFDLDQGGRATRDTWSDLLLLYSCYPHSAHKNYEGVLYDILEHAGHSNPAVVKDAVFGRTTNNKDLSLALWKRKCESDYPPDDVISLVSSEDGEHEAALQATFLYPIIMEWDFDTEKRTLLQATEEYKTRLLVPLYDAWELRKDGPEGWGGLQAVLVIVAEPQGEIDRPECWPNYGRMLERCSEFAREVADAAMRRALAKPIDAPYDLVRHFLNTLIEVQDWEEAAVFYGRTPEFNFRRHRTDSDQIHEGVRECWREGSLSDPGQSLPDFAPSEGLSGDPDGGFYMWWTCGDGGQDLWSKDVLPGLSPNELAAVTGTSIRFRFPRACRIPVESDRSARAFLVEWYRRQQVELMRGLIPKVRARRAALRNAVSAIMARNMSHNIGSHVLARYATAIGDIQDLEKKADPRQDFLFFLQKRMDFLAELGTNDEALGAQPLSLGAQLSRLNYFDENKRLAGGSPLLKYIAGKADLNANVTIGGGQERLFSCPGGEVGVHALYVILENIIRNSARHNTVAEERVEIELTIGEPEKGLFELRIRDLGTKLLGDGTRGGSIGSEHHKGEASVSWMRLRGSELKRRVDADRSAGGPESVAVPHAINYIIEHEPIIDSDGRPNPKYWGVREMQICAQYLRQLPLSDLEDVPWSDRDPHITERPTLRAELEDNCLSYVVYLQEAKLLATIERGESTTGEANNGFARVTLSDAVLSGIEAVEENLELAKMGDLRNYAFVAYERDDESVRRWIEKLNQNRLPIRVLDLPSAQASGEQPLTWGEASGWVEEGHLTEVWECLHRAYAHNILSSSSDSSLLAGLAVGCNQSLASVATRLTTNSQPIGAIAGSDEWMMESWMSSISRHFNGERFSGCFWIDHVNERALNTFSKWAHDAREMFSKVAWEPCFGDSPCTSELSGVGIGQGWELISAALPRVVVMDERIQAQRKEVSRGNITLQSYWDGMRVATPTEERYGTLICDLENPDLDACNTWLRSLYENEPGAAADFLIVHLTVLEKLESATRDGVSSLAALLDGSKIRPNAPIVVVTGRGAATFARSDLDRVDAGLVKRLRRLPVSAVLEYLVSKPSKLGLMRALWSAS